MAGLRHPAARPKPGAALHRRADRGLRRPGEPHQRGEPARRGGDAAHPQRPGVDRTRVRGTDRCAPARGAGSQRRRADRRRGRAPARLVRPRVTPSTLRRRLVIAFLALAVVIAVGLTIAVAAAVRMYAAQERVTDRLFTAYSLAGELNEALVDQETGFRGYALTREEDFLAPYVDGRDRAEDVNAQLDLI